MRKRPFALLLAAVLLTQQLTVAAFAEDTYEATEPQEIETLSEDNDWIEADQYAIDYVYPGTFEDCETRALTEGETLRKGIDVSQFQGTIDWEAVAESGIEFAFIRVGYRGWGTGRLCDDSTYKANIQGALDAGIQVGVYVYSQAITVEEGIEEAQYLIDRVKDYDITLPLVIDYEYADNQQGRLYNAHLSKAVATDICNAFVYTAQNAGYSGAVYANVTMLRNQLNESELSCVWLANYPNTYSGVGTTSYSGDYDFWQFTSKGTVDGISGNVDMDFWFDDGNFGTLTSWMPFLDVSRDRWSYSDIRYVYEQGIVNGTSDQTFSPGSKTTRGQLVTMLYRMAGEPAVTGTSGFTDLTQDYYKTAVTWAKQQGIINGTTETTFSPGAYVTRQDLVTMLYRMAGQPAAKGSLSGFTDAGQVSSYAENAVKWAVAEGILQGSNAKLTPKSYATREQVAAFLSRYLQ